jgi:hypothetical protein
VFLLNVYDCDIRIINITYNPINALKHEVLLNQGFSNCGTRSTGGASTVQWCTGLC